MAIEGSASTEIKAPIAEVFRVAADVENSPAWQPEIKLAEVIERDDDGRQTLVKTETDARVRRLTSNLRFSYDEPNGLSWSQQDGDLKSVEGNWQFEELGEDLTRATYSMNVDLGRMLSMVVRGPVVDLVRAQLVDTMPEKLRDYVERQG